MTGTTTPGELTVTPVYWLPAGYSVPSGYSSTIDQFIADAAADSGKTTNVFATLTQYTNSSGTNLRYLLHAGTPITDTHSYPANGCTPDPGAIWSDGTGYSVCITNAQLLSEASAFTTAHGLPHSDLAHLYMFFLPEKVETCFTSTDGASGGACSLNAHGGFCGYHAFASPPLVADMNYAYVDSPTRYTCSSDAGSNTRGNQSPNGNIAADTEISVTSHETSETITDPQGTAWWDGGGNEIGDDCAYIYGDSLSFQGSPASEYNQTINGHHYFIQEEFSNQDFSSNHTYSCLQQEDAVIVTPNAGPGRTVVTMDGSGFASGENVTVYFYKTATQRSKLCKVVTTSAVGSFACSHKIPARATVGLHQIVAVSSTSLRQATTTFNVT